MRKCPSQLTAPVLHTVLNDEALKPFIFGAKGVGSQGDGTAQFLCKDEASAAQLKLVFAEKCVRRFRSCRMVAWLCRGCEYEM